jgi:hypothetical protein
LDRIGREFRNVDGRRKGVIDERAESRKGKGINIGK